MSTPRDQLQPRAAALYAVGDTVMHRRPGTLGANGMHGTIEAVFPRGRHNMVTVRFGHRTETFAQDIYVRASTT